METTNFPTTANRAAMPQTNELWHTISLEQATELLQSDRDRGLSSDRIDRRQQYFGVNEIKETGGRSPLTILSIGLLTSCRFAIFNTFIFLKPLRIGFGN